LKVQLPSLGVETYIKDYTISKKIDDFGVVVELDTKAIFDRDNGYSLLLENTAQGNTKETATITINCGSEDVEIEGYVLHNEGKVNFKDCRMEKSIKFANPIECIIDKEINIFDYTPSNTQTVQGNLLRQTFTITKTKFIGPSSVAFPALDEILSYVGGIPDRSADGYYPEHATITVHPRELIIENEYLFHIYTLSVIYVGAFSATKFSFEWVDSPLGGYHYTGFPDITFDAPESKIITIGLNIYTSYTNTAGIVLRYKDIPISNTFLVNEIFEDIFSCTGIDLISNFFNINTDNTNPSNFEYEFAAEYLHSMKIAQSFDIIRESAIEDSFGKSGTFSAKQMILEFNKLFNLILIYDSTFDVMRWEHVSYFESKGIDFELQGIQYEFSDDADINKEQINIEAWFMAQPSPTDGFYTTKIDYQNYQLNSEINEVSKKSDKFMTDLFGCLNNVAYEGDAYKKLFFLLSTDGENVIGLNRSMSMRSLVENLHYRNRPLKTGKHDGKSVVFSGYSIGLEAEISFFGSFKVFNKINPTNTVKLNVNGNGTWLIDEIEIEDKKITLKIKK
jgi:hypothetical protein